MKTIFLLLFCMFLLQSCVKESSTLNSNAVDIEPLSSWKLAEVYLDPGDGSGDFTPYEGETKVVHFFSDNSIVSNMSLCQMFSLDNNDSFVSLYNENTVYPQSCNLDYQNRIQYQINEQNMIFSYMCFEACLEKYERVY